MTAVRTVFPKIRAIFSNFRKSAGETSPPSPPPRSSYAPAMKTHFQVRLGKEW